MKKYLRSALSLILVFAMVCPYFTASASGLSDNDENVIIVMDDTGKEMRFETFEDDLGNITIKYYYNGRFIKSYSFNTTSNQIRVQCEDNMTYNLTTEDYVECSSDSYIDNDNNAVMYATRSNTRNLGVFYYKDTDYFTLPHVSLTCDTIDTEKVTYRVTTPSNSSYADSFATLTNYLIGIVFVTVTISGGLAASIAASVLEGMIAASGGQVVGGLITAAISDYYKAIRISYKTTATFSCTNHTFRFHADYSGSAHYVAYDGNNYESSRIYEGITPQLSTWNNTDFSIVTWDDTVRRHYTYAWPGLKKVIVNDYE